MSSREGILAEVNMLKVLVWRLWEESHGSIKKNDWNELKKDVIREMRNKWDKRKNNLIYYLKYIILISVKIVQKWVVRQTYEIDKSNRYRRNL